LRLSEFILGEMPAILAEWDEFAQTLKPAARGMTSKELRNHAELMLTGIADDIISQQSVEEQIIKSHGGEARGAQILMGEEHGIARLDSRFTTEQLASEFRALRASVLKLWGQKVNLSSPDIADIIRFNEAIDQLLAASISSFAQATKKSSEEASQRKEQFLAMLAHELRNPLAPISASAEMLRALPGDVGVVRRAGSVITRQVAHMSSLVDDLLEVSRVTNGAIELNVENLDLRIVLDSAIEQAQPKISAKHHRLHAPTLESPMPISGDKKRLIQIIVNLLDNAAKYTPDGGNIRLEVKADSGQVEIVVEDDGVGIAPEFIPHVFELFSQANPSMDRTSGGLGLGLPLVKNLVEQHCGKVRCVSPGIGKGSKFSVILPTNSDLPHDQQDETEPGSQLGAHPAIKLMVVDDNVDAAETISLLLTTLGFQVVTVHDSIKALELAEGEMPDAFLLDIGLPAMDGNQLAQKIRALPEGAQSVLIAITGYSQRHNREEAIKSGFDKFMTKPVEIGALQAVLNSVLPISRRRAPRRAQAADGRFPPKPIAP